MVGMGLETKEECAEKPAPTIVDAGAEVVEAANEVLEESAAQGDAEAVEADAGAAHADADAAIADDQAEAANKIVGSPEEADFYIRKAKKFGIAAIILGVLLPPVGIVCSIVALSYAFRTIDAPKGTLSPKVGVGCALVGFFVGLKIGLLEAFAIGGML